MTPTPPLPLHSNRPLLVWWILWGSVIAGVVVIYLKIASGRPIGSDPDQDMMATAISSVFLLVATVIRWLVLPRFQSRTKALPVFVLGLALAEACALVGMFLGQANRDALVALGLVGMVQFAPIFARRLV